jgi:hypothetical protein
MLIQNVKILGRGGDRIALGCEYQGQRYHVWLDHISRDLGATLYKKPPLDQKDGYRTQRLHVDSKFSRRLIAMMLAVMDDENLLEKFYAQERDHERGEIATLAQRLREARMHEAAPAMLQLLKSFAMFDGKYAGGEPMDAVDLKFNRDALQEQANQLIAQIEGGA